MATLVKLPKASGKAAVIAATVALGAMLSVHWLGARHSEAPLPAFVENSRGESLVPAVPPREAVPASAAVAAAEKGRRIPTWVSLTVGFYVSRTTHQPLWVIAFHNEDLPAMVFPNMEPRHRRWARPNPVWHTSYDLVDARTGGLVGIVDGG